MLVKAYIGGANCGKFTLFLIPWGICGKCDKNKRERGNCGNSIDVLIAVRPVHSDCGARVYWRSGRQVVK